MRRLLKCKDGLVVVSAPPASGATTTVYAILRELADEGRSIVTVEDPIEYDLPGIGQLNVDFSRRGSFIGAMTDVAQRNPNVVYVSDVRDADTARVIVETAAAGKLVIVTMHAQTAVGVVDRLTKLGVESARLAQVLRGAVALRLLRRTCPECVEHNATPPTVEESRLAGHYGASQKVRAVGCLRCGKTGYKGRLPIAEVLVTTTALAAGISTGAPAEELQTEAIAGGMRSLRQAALERVSAGETTLQEIDRVLGDEAADPRAPARRPHVLVVDDDGVTRMYARQLLENSGYTVSEATDGVIGLEHIAAAEDLALVVLDIEMPHLGGRDVLGRIRRSVATHALPVVVLTGLEGEGTEAQLMELGADDYLHKPIDPAIFAARVSAVLRRAGG
jgi:CheY-like chemotaxis protein